MPSDVEVRTDNRITTQDSNAVGPDTAQQLHEWITAPKVDDRITVAVMDSGIHADLPGSHPWFTDATVVNRFDATGSGEGGDAVGHGSACASVYARNTPAVDLVDVRIFGKSGKTGFDVIRKAYEWLIDHADEIDVVNMSWGARKDVPEINALHERLVSKGVHDVVAAGNTGGEGGSPSTSKVAFSAGAVDKNGDLTRFTSRDPNQDNPDVAAIGKNVKLARAPGTSMGKPLSDDFVKASGTSFAGPYTGAAYVNALYRKRQSWDKALERAAPDIPGTPADGEGLLKLKPAVGGDGGGDKPDEPSNPTGSAFVLSAGDRDVAITDVDWLPDADSTIEKTGEDKKGVDVRFRKNG